MMYQDSGHMELYIFFSFFFFLAIGRCLIRYDYVLHTMYGICSNFVEVVLYALRVVYDVVLATLYLLLSN
jgi:hypothetical protein